MSGATRLALVVALVGISCSQAHSATIYQLVDLGDLPGGDNTSKAYAINNHGQVVGEGNVALGGVVHAFLWDQATGMRDIGETLGSNRSIANGINDLGQIVGYNVVDLGGGSSTLHAFKWDATNGTKDLGAGMANDINNSGQIVGQQASHAALWTYAGGFQDLGVLSGNSSSTANGINNVGQVVGFSESNPDRAFIWSASEGMRDMNALTGGFGQHPVANDLNDLAQVVGRHESAFGFPGANMGHAFVWSESNGVILDLGTVPEERSEAFAINNLGQAVGIQKFPGQRGRAFVWDSVVGVQDLHDLVDASGAGWELEYAYDINDHGQIVGSGLGPNGYHAFLLNPVPEPSSIVMAIWGFIGLLAWHCQRRCTLVRAR